MSRAGERRVFSGLWLLWSYVRFQFRAAYAFRASFWSQVASMFLNDGVWIAYWILFFHRFPNLSGWREQDILLVWGITASAFGIVVILFGNAMNLQSIIQSGELDVYLTNPKPVLFHTLISRQSTTGWGDLLFGIAVLVIDAPRHFVPAAETALAVLASALLLLGFAVLTQCIGFWTGAAGGFGLQLINAYISFQTYPPSIFRGWFVKLLIYVVIPSGVAALLPFSILHGVLRWLPVCAFLLGILWVVGSRGVFYAGLRRYTSGNRTTVRS